MRLGRTAAFAADDTIKIGILHSLSGTMAISETTLKDVMLMLIDEQNKKGGVLGKKLEAVVVDPASNWPLFAEKAKELIEKDKVSVVFGCWTSVSRKSVLPVFKELNSILFYPVQYEGEESERNVFYTGAAPNQQAIPAVDYLMSEDGGSVKRWVLEGTDYVYPRTTNKILAAYLKLKGVPDEDVMINYTPFGFSDWQTEVSKIKAFGSAGKKTAVVSTINGDANVPFYKELGNQGIKATDIPVVAFSVGEEELAGLDTKPLVGHLAAWNYFESIDTPANKDFIAKWHEFTKKPNRTTNDPMEAHYIGFNMWVKGVEKAQSFEPDKVIPAMIGVAVPNLTGGISTMMTEPSHHQARLYRRDPGRRPAQHGLADAGTGRGAGMVALPRGFEGPDRRLAPANVVRQLQRQDRQVRRLTLRRLERAAEPIVDDRQEPRGLLPLLATGAGLSLDHAAMARPRSSVAVERTMMTPLCARRLAAHLRRRSARSASLPSWRSRRAARADAVDDTLAKFLDDKFPQTAAAIGELSAEAPPQAAAILEALGDNRLLIDPADHIVAYKTAAGALLNAKTGETIPDSAPPPSRRSASTTRFEAPSKARWDR